MGPGAFVTGSFRVVDALLRDRRMGKTYLRSVEARYGKGSADQPVFRALSRTFLMMNPPLHTRLRASLMQAINKDQVAEMRQIVEDTTEDLLDRIGTASQFDLIADYALPLPVEIICRLLDIPVTDGAALGIAASHLANALDLAPLDGIRLAEANEAARTLEEYFEVVVEQRRIRPSRDLVSSLLSVESDGIPLREEEIISNVILLFLAGHETTSNMIGNAMVALFRAPDELKRLKEGLNSSPGLLSQAVAECMRFDGAVQMTVRTALEDIALEDVNIARGSIVFLLIGAANRDPAVFPSPDKLDIGRNGAPSLAFGGGIHYCLGARLALLETETAISGLLKRFPELQPADLANLAWHHRNNLRGVQQLLVRV